MAFLGSVAAVIGLHEPSFRWGFVDEPTDRKTHGAPVPVTGGLVAACCLLLTGLVLGLESRWVAALGLALVLYVVGVKDDRRSLGTPVRLLTQGFVALALVLLGFRVEDFGALGHAGPLVGGMLSLFCIVAFVNAANMVDGADGLLGGTLAPGFFALGLIDPSPAGALACAMGGCTAAFLVAGNWPTVKSTPRRYRTFLGNGGANLLSLMMAVFLLEGARSGSLHPGAVPYFALVPLIEICFSVTRRVVGRQRPTKADCEHLHHLALRSGCSRVVMAQCYLLIASAALAVGLLAPITDALLWWSAAAVLVGAVVAGVGYGLSQRQAVAAEVRL